MTRRDGADPVPTTAPMAKSIVKTNNPTVFRMTSSRSNVVAMIRGVSCQTNYLRP